MTIVFFLACFGLSWLVWVALAPGLFIIGVFAPAIVALALTWQQGGRRAVRRLLARVVDWRRAPRWYLFAIAFIPAVKLVAAVVHRLATGVWPQFGGPVYVMAAALLVSTWVQAGEEIGWRGYALPRLAQRLGLSVASMVLGVIWALWHLPHFYMPGSPLLGQSLALYVVQVTALSVAMSWLYWRSGQSLLLVMLLHAAVNNTKDLVPSVGQPIIAWSTAGLLWVAAAFFMLQMKGAKLEEETNDGIHVQTGRARPQPVP